MAGRRTFLAWAALTAHRADFQGSGMIAFGPMSYPRTIITAYVTRQEWQPEMLRISRRDLTDASRRGDESGQAGRRFGLPLGLFRMLGNILLSVRVGSRAAVNVDPIIRLLCGAEQT